MLWYELPELLLGCGADRRHRQFQGPPGTALQRVHAGRRTSGLQPPITISEMHTQYAPCQLEQRTVTLKVLFQNK